MPTYIVDRGGTRIGKLDIKDGIVILKGNQQQVEIKIDNGIWELYLVDEENNDSISVQLIKKGVDKFKMDTPWQEEGAYTYIKATSYIGFSKRDKELRVRTIYPLGAYPVFTYADKDDTIFVISVLLADPDNY